LWCSFMFARWCVHGQALRLLCGSCWGLAFESSGTVALVVPGMKIEIVAYVG